MSNKARLSETRFNPEGGVDLDAIAERVAERDHVDAAELDFDAPPNARKDKCTPIRVAHFS